jgi:hypothetical protein
MSPKNTEFQTARFTSENPNIHGEKISHIPIPIAIQNILFTLLLYKEIYTNQNPLP